MEVKLQYRCQMFCYTLLICYGQFDMVSVQNVPSSSIEGERNAVPNNELEELPPLAEKSFNAVYIEGYLSPLSVKPFSSGIFSKYKEDNYSREPLIRLSTSEQTSNRQKRSYLDDKEEIQGLNKKFGKYGQHSPSALYRNTNHDDGAPTYYVSKLIPKNPLEPVVNIYEDESFVGQDLANKFSNINLSNGNTIISRLETLVDSTEPLKVKNVLVPRTIRSEGSHRINLNTGGSFTPRLGRSRESDNFNFIPKSVFKERLSNSEGPQTILLDTGNPFTPRLGRSENSNRILLNGGSPFKPRLGRSENSNRILLNNDLPFTPRLGRSESSNQIPFGRSSSFTPRLGRASSAGWRAYYSSSNFTPRLGRSRKERSPH